MKRGKKRTISILVALFIVTILYGSAVPYTGWAFADSDESILSVAVSKILDLFSFKDHLQEELPISLGSDVCGNNVVDPGEQCDPPGSACLITPDPNVCNSQCLCVQVPTPSIASISPASTSPRTPFTLTITGSNFLNNPPAIVKVGDSSYVPSSQTQTQVTVDISGLDAGIYNVFVVNGNQVQSNLLRLIIIAAQPQVLVLENNRVRMDFKNTGRNIYPETIIDVETGYIMKFDEAPAWRLELKDTSTGTKTSIEPGSSVFSSFNAQVTGTTDKTLTANWNNVQVAGDSFDVEATYVLPVNEKVGRWSIEITPQTMTRYSFFSVDTPILSIQKLQDDALLIPYNGGALILDPLHPAPPIPQTISIFDLYDGGLGGNPGRFGLQLLSYIDRQDNELLYFASTDTNGNVKGFPIKKESQGHPDDNLVLRVKNFPSNNNVPGTTYTMPYTVEFGVMEGDWYDAAMRYRSWALPNFAQRGKLEVTTEVAPAFKDIGLASAFGFDIIPGNPLPPPTINPADIMQEWKSALGVDHALSTHWWTWWEGDGVPSSHPESWILFPDVRLRPTVANALQQARNQGDLVALYYISLNLNIGSPFYNANSLSRALLKDDSGSIVRSSPQNWPFQVGSVNLDSSLIDMPSLYENVILPPLIAAGTTGIYYDVLTAGNNIPYFDPSRPNGDSTAYVRGAKALLARTRAILRDATNNNFFITSEVTDENYIDLTDLLYQDVFMPASTSPGKAFIVPLWESVYGEYLETSYFQPASAFDFTTYIHNGALPFVAIEYNFPDPIVRQLIQKFYVGYFKKYAILRNGLGSKFIKYGQRMDDPEFVTDFLVGVPDLIKPYTKYAPNIPAVYPSIWKASDGSLGILLANADDMPGTERPIQVTVDFQKYGLVPGETYNLVELTETGKTPIGTRTGTFTLDVNVQSLRVKMFALERAATSTCGNGILEPGEDCETGIPCAVGSCNNLCRCEVVSPPPAPSSGGGGGGSGRGGGSQGFVTYFNFDNDKSYIVTANKGATFFAKYNDNQYSMRIEKLEFFPMPKVAIKILPRYQSIVLKDGGKSKVFFDSDDVEDIEIRAVEINKNMKAVLTFNRLTQFSNRYLGPKQEPPKAKTPVVKSPQTQPVQELPQSTVSDEDLDPRFIILTKALAGSIILLIFSVVFYIVVRISKSK